VVVDVEVVQPGFLAGPDIRLGPVTSAAGEHPRANRTDEVDVGSAGQPRAFHAHPAMYELPVHEGTQAAAGVAPIPEQQLVKLARVEVAIGVESGEDRDIALLEGGQNGARVIRAERKG